MGLGGVRMPVSAGVHMALLQRGLTNPMVMPRPLGLVVLYLVRLSFALNDPSVLITSVLSGPPYLP